MGSLGISPDSFAFLKCGVSPRPPRIHRPTMTSRIEAMNGMRQPMPVRKSSPNMDTTANAAEASSMPMVMPICGTEPKNPRFSFGAYS